MDRLQLKRWLDDGLSLKQIGALSNRDPSTVGYWVQKHGLTANGREKYAPRGAVSRDQLEPMIERGATLEQIATAVDRSIGTVRYWIEKHHLEPPKAVRRRQADRARANGDRAFTGRCRVHGETTFVVENSGRARCRRCRMERVVEWRRRKKVILVTEAGGRCQLCGYHRCPAALQFHHVDPSTKSFPLSMRGLTRSIEACRREAAKCVLLCANCHAEVEIGYSTLSEETPPLGRR